MAWPIAAVSRFAHGLTNHTQRGGCEWQVIVGPADILKRWGSYFIDKITVPEIDAWVPDLTTNYSPETIWHHVGLFRRIVGKARG
ncbi:MAG TPA: hypothetical protein VF516_16535 [Kofleriaceae bacterium]